jgi:pentose-5-phosphate-3-epimerase
MEIMFENYDRKIDKINAALNEYGIKDLEEAYEICKAKGLDIEIEADGGITPDNIAPLVANGLTVAVAGSAVFKAEKPAEAIAGLKGNK